MSVYSCTLEVSLPLFDALSEEKDESDRFTTHLEKTKTGVKILITAEDPAGLTAGANHWLRLIKASSGVYKVI